MGPSAAPPSGESSPAIVPRPAIVPAPAALVAAAAGGVIGALARWALGLVWPTAGGTFPWTTLAINLSGCLAVGVVAGVLDARPRTGRLSLVRPFAVTGVLGGYTTFSTWSVDVDRLAAAGHLATAAADVVSTLLGAGLAVALGLGGPGPRGPVDPSVHP